MKFKNIAFTGVMASILMIGAGYAGTLKVATKAYVDTQDATKVTANDSITGATKTKITYDAKGLVTNGADLAVTDLPDDVVVGSDNITVERDATSKKYKVSAGTAAKANVATSEITTSSTDTSLVTAAQVASYVDSKVGNTTETTASLVSRVSELETDTTNIAVTNSETDGTSTIKDDDGTSTTVYTQTKTNTLLNAKQNASDSTVAADGTYSYITAGTGVGANLIALDTKVKANTDAIGQINDSDPMTSGITSAKVSTYDGYAATIAGKQDADVTYSSTNYLNNATTLTGADIALDTQVKINATAIGDANSGLTKDVATNATNIATNTSDIAALKGSLAFPDMCKSADVRCSLTTKTTGTGENATTSLVWELLTTPLEN